MISHQGKNYARVSDIIRPFSSLDHIDPEVLANKCRIGTSVHEAINDDIRDVFPSMEPDCVGYFKSYMCWKGYLCPEFVQSEKRYFCDRTMITGQIDCLIRMPYSKSLLLVDFKTSAKESKETWTMQAHLYYHLLTENNIEVFPKFLFIKLSKTGNLPTVYEYTYSDKIHEKCMGAIEEFWKKERSKDDLFI